MKNLVSGEQIRSTMDKYRPELYVYSIEGSVAKSPWATPEEISTAYARELERAKAQGARPMTAWVSKIPACLTADYPGKAEKLAADKAAYEAARLLENGEIIRVENRYYRVKYVGIQYSDPIHLIEVEIKDKY